jgi:hypothetical protein
MLEIFYSLQPIFDKVDVAAPFHNQGFYLQDNQATDKRLQQPMTISTEQSFQNPQK